MLLCLCTLLPALGNHVRAAQTPPDLRQRALENVAKRHKLPVDDLAVVKSAVVTYHLRGKTAFSYKIRHKKSGSVYGALLDQSGQELDATLEATQERAAYTTKYGRLDPALDARLKAARPDELIAVAIWVKAPEHKPSAPPLKNGRPSMTRAEVDRFVKEMNDERAAAIQPLVDTVAERLKGLGVVVTTNTLAPRIEAQLTPTLIRRVERWQDVERIYLRQSEQLLNKASGPLPEPLALAQARTTVRADFVHARGITGAGVKVAVIEKDGVAATNNPYLSVTQDPLNQCPNAPFPHITEVAGVIGSSHYYHSGIAPDASLRTGGGCGEEALVSQTTYARNWGARIFNFSMGHDSERTVDDSARWLDNLVRYYHVTASVSSGNNGAPLAPDGESCPYYDTSPGDVWSPGTAYNVIMVGSFMDNGNGSWVGDAMDPCSSWRNPVSMQQDRDKPELVAPGENITTTYYKEVSDKLEAPLPAPWLVTGSGTSMATPVVSGIAALMMERDPNLEVYPTSVKAILMATAVHDLDPEQECFEAGEGELCGILGKYDGAGGVVADRADDVVRGINGDWGVAIAGCEMQGGLTLGTMNVTAGIPTRVAIAWLTDSTDVLYQYQPSADVDLRIINDQVPPDSWEAEAAASLSWDNNVEFVEFTPTHTGSYTIQAPIYRCDADPRLIGWAWYQGDGPPPPYYP
jgi:subtilisin family serine protease